MAVEENYRRILESVQKSAVQAGRKPDEITLIAVSKGFLVEEMLPVYQAGCRDFGESRIQEAFEKMPSFPSDFCWHLIGSLQKNKVRKALEKFSLIHSVDSLELARKISETAKSLGRQASILLQANTSGEASKQGLSPQEWEETFPKVLELPFLEVRGLMTLAPYEESKVRIGRCFAALRQLRDTLEKNQKGVILPHLSMGMSHDYLIAIQEGATLLRVGRAIFG